MTNEVTVPKNMMPTLAPEMRQLFAGQFGEAMDSFGGDFNRISLRGMRIRLIEGGEEILAAPDFLDVIILGIAPESHHVWYKDAYTGEEGVQPDAVWSEHEQAPDTVPASALVKDANGRNQYSIKRRIVVAAFETTEQGLVPNFDTVFSLDVGGMSLFGDDIPLVDGNKAYNFSNYMSALKRVGVYPCVIPTRLMLNPNSSVPELRFIPACSNGQIQLLPDQTIAQVAGRVLESDVIDGLKWRTEAPVQQAPVQQAPAQQAPVQQAPVQQAPVQQAPAQQAPVQQAPAQQAPVQQAPAQQAPVQQANTQGMADELAQELQSEQVLADAATHEQATGSVTSEALSAEIEGLMAEFE